LVEDERKQWEEWMCDDDAEFDELAESEVLPAKIEEEAAIQQLTLN
jgi:hypothetical protein